MTNKGFGTKSEIPSHYKTVEEVINQYCPDVWDMIKKKNGIKRTGSLDEIPMKKRKEIKKVLKIYINTKAQRVDAIEISKLLKILRGKVDLSMNLLELLIYSVITNIKLMFVLMGCTD